MLAVYLGDPVPSISTDSAVLRKSEDTLELGHALLRQRAVEARRLNFGYRRIEPMQIVQILLQNPYIRICHTLVQDNSGEKHGVFAVFIEGNVLDNAEVSVLEPIPRFTVNNASLRQTENLLE